MLNVEMYDLLMEVAGAFYGAMAAIRASSGEEHTEPLSPLLQIRAGYAESPAWFLIQAAEFDPEPLTVENLRIRDIYASERLVQALLELMASEQWLDRSVQDTYQLTIGGRVVLARNIESQRRLITKLEPLSTDDTTMLANVLGRLINASLTSPTPPDSWCLAHSRNRAPEEKSHALLHIRQYLDDFNAFRDDAHMAAWQFYNVSGYTWEAFSLVCSGTAITADDIFANLYYRGYSRGEYATALAQLVQRGWLEADTEGGAHVVTAAGRKVRERVESLTNQYFYAPWASLDEEEITGLHDLLVRLQDHLQAASNLPQA